MEITDNMKNHENSLCEMYNFQASFSRTAQRKTRKDTNCTRFPQIALQKISNTAMKKRKGQWLLITALLFSITLTSVVLITSERTDIQDISYGNKNMFDNIKKESQNAINIILSENYTSSHLNTNLKIYTEFLEHYANEHNTNITGYYIIGIPYQNNLNITIANFLKTPMQNLNLTVASNTQHNLHLNNANFTTFHFSSVPGNFQFTCNFTYKDKSNPTIMQNNTLNTTTKRIFSILHLKLESKNEILTHYKIN
ncbi:MAG: hypothetical protein DRN71_03600 [Candidatus Nanohalarchaeota archaeon]|nr:MAG: hypothetical protein DRN71_03600 [Candidatus Nanohaloarchaeota archaeon]